MKKPLQVLIAEDNPDDAEIVVAELRRAGFDPQWERVQTEEDFLEKLALGPDIVISDYAMPVFSAPQALELLKKSGLDIPFIIVSGTIGEDVAVEMMRMGASDYFLKDRLGRLGQAAIHALEECRLRAERRQAVVDLHFQKLLLESQSEASIDGILTVGADAKIISYNGRFVQMWGISHELLAARLDGPVLKSVVDCIVDSQGFLDRVGYLYEHPDLLSREEILLKDGRVFDRYTSPVKGTDGTYYGRIWTFRDITERKRAEEDLRTTHAQLRELLDHTPAVIFRLQLEGEKVIPRMVSENITALLGFTPAEALSYEWWLEHLHPGDRERAVASIPETLRRGTIRIEYRIRHKDGSHRWVEENRRVVCDAKGEPAEFVGLWTDITERKRAEEVLHTVASKEADRRKTKPLIELGLIAVLAVVVFIVGDYTDMFLPLFRYFAETDQGTVDTHADELGGTLIFICLALLVFSYRRWKENKAEIVSQAHVTKALRQLHDEMDEQVRQRTAELDNRNKDLQEEINARKRAAEALEDSEGRFRQLAENINEIFWLVDRSKNQMLYISPAYEKIWGRRCEDLYASPETWLDAIHPGDRERVRRAATTKQEAGTYDEEYRIIQPDGAIRWIHDRAFPVRDASGKIQRIAGVALDISDRKQASERIAEQAALIDQTHDAIIVRDMEGLIQFWSKGAERLYGFRSDEVLGKKSDELLYGGKTAKYDEALNAVLARGEWSGELEQVTKEGRKVAVQTRWTLVRDEPGNPKSILAINTDVTEKKKIEAQFLRAQRMESIGTLAGGVAHDLNNILSPIMMAIDILREVTDAEQKKYILDTIDKSAQRGSEIIRQILSFSRGMDGQRIEVQPKHLVKDMEHIIRNTFPKNIRLEIDFPPEPWTILGDPTQIHQILLNLCVNARDAMPEGGQLAISVENRAIDEHYIATNPNAKVGDHVCICVTDTGTGMPASIIEKIFDPFFTTKEMGMGTGLGLSTVMAIVKSHGGFLNVYSEPGKGTTFRIYLPATSTGAESTGEAEQPVLPRGHGETVLIIDDETSILTITSQTLEAFGYRVLTADNGAAAIAVYAQHMRETAVVLTDMMMPVMDGAATIHALLKINPGVKIIAASGLNENAGRSTNAGIKHFLAKPYTAAALLKMIRAVLDGDPAPIP